MGAKTKLIQRRSMYRQADNTIQSGKVLCEVTSSKKQSAAKNVLDPSKSREARHLMRRIAFEIGSGSDVSDLLKYNQLTVSLLV